MGDKKSFFHQWCAKNGKEPQFDVRPTGPKHRQRFLCELRVPELTMSVRETRSTRRMHREILPKITLITCSYESCEFERCAERKHNVARHDTGQFQARNLNTSKIGVSRRHGSK